MVPDIWRLVYIQIASFMGSTGGPLLGPRLTPWSWLYGCSFPGVLCIQRPLLWISGSICHMGCIMAEIEATHVCCYSSGWLWKHSVFAWCTSELFSRTLVCLVIHWCFTLKMPFLYLFEILSVNLSHTSVLLVKQQLLYIWKLKCLVIH